MGVLITRSSVTSAETFDRYIGPSGSDSNDGLTPSTPWAITALNSKRGEYGGLRIGFLDGTYNVHTAHNANVTNQYEPTYNIEGGSAGSPTVLKAVNARQAHITAKSGATYGGPTSQESPGILGNNFLYSSVSPGYITIDGLRISGARSVLLRFGLVDSDPGSTYTSSIIVQNCELFDCNATEDTTEGNKSAISANNCNGFQLRNCYIHDIVGYAVGDCDHLSATIQWGSINSLYEYNTIVNAGSLYGKQTHGVGQYNATIRYNYIDMSGYTTGRCVGIQDFCGNIGSVEAGTYLRAYHNVVIADSGIEFRRGSSNGRVQSESIQVYNNTIVCATSPGDAASWFECQAPDDIEFWNNHCLRPTDNSSLATPFNEYGGVCISPSQSKLDYNGYDSSNPKWSVCTDGAATYPSASDASLALWKTRTGKEAGSLTLNLSSIVATGDLAEYFQPAGSAIDAGKSDGTSSGSTCDIGAWGGASPPDRIGCDF